jgi:hypothetical protein
MSPPPPKRYCLHSTCRSARHHGPEERHRYIHCRENFTFVLHADEGEIALDETHCMKPVYCRPKIRQQTLFNMNIYSKVGNSPSVAAYPSIVRYVNKTVTTTTKVLAPSEYGNPAPGK